MSYDALCKIVIKAAGNKLNIQSTMPQQESISTARKPFAAGIGSRIIKTGAREFPDPREMDPSESL